MGLRHVNRSLNGVAFIYLRRTGPSGPVTSYGIWQSGPDIALDVWVYERQFAECLFRIPRVYQTLKQRLGHPAFAQP